MGQCLTTGKKGLTQRRGGAEGTEREKNKGRRGFLLIVMGRAPNSVSLAPILSSRLDACKR